MDSVDKAVEKFRESMPVLAEAFGDVEVRASINNVVAKEADRDLALAAMAGDLDDNGSFARV